MRILVVEDDVSAWKPLELLLKLKGFEYSLCGDGSEAWELYQSGDFSVVLLDWVLPGMDGLELCRRIRSHPKGQNTYVLMVTGRTDPSDFQAVLNAGADDYLAKPYSPRVLEIRLAVVRRQVKNLQMRRRAEKKVEQALTHLEQSHDDLLSILNQFPLGSSMCDDKGRITFLSAAAERILNLQEEDVLGKRWDKALPLGEGEIEMLQRMMGGAEADREKVTISPEAVSTLKSWIDVTVRNDPRNPQRKILLFEDVTDLHQLRQELTGKAQFYDMVGKSREMLQVFQLVSDLAAVDSTVLIEGETGTGKELVARAVHAASSRAKKPFVALNCAGLTESLVASQLFGHCRGAFTGAIADHKGLFEDADGGTLFLDEIGDVPLSVQINLLRVLESREVQRIGESKARKVDVRVLSATNQDLDELVRERQFRRDLLYRLRVARISLPPLRNRREDIPLLVEFFLRMLGPSLGKKVTQVGQEAMRLLMGHSWPGNVRELRNAIEYSMVRAKGNTVRHSDLPPEVQPGAMGESLEGLDDRQAIMAALRKAGGNRSKAAKLLGMSRATFYRRLSALGINADFS